jgi:flagellar protein FlgJ
MNPVHPANLPASHATTHTAAHAAFRVSSPEAAPTTRLRQTASRLEGVFVEQLFKAMRETVPQDGAVDGGGEEIFTSLFDQELAGRAPAQWQSGLGRAIVRALEPRAATPEHR